MAMQAFDRHRRQVVEAAAVAQDQVEWPGGAAPSCQGILGAAGAGSD